MSLRKKKKRRKDLEEDAEEEKEEEGEEETSLLSKILLLLLLLSGLHCRKRRRRKWRRAEELERHSEGGGEGGADRRQFGTSGHAGRFAAEAEDARETPERQACKDTKKSCGAPRTRRGGCRREAQRTNTPQTQRRTKPKTP